MMMLLAESTIRSLLLFAAMLGLFHLLRIRSSSTQLMALRIGLVAALLMPLLLRLRVVSIPVELEMPPVLLAIAAQADEASFNWVATLMSVYFLVAGALGVRLALGLIASWRVYRAATPIRCATLADHSVRTSAAIDGPGTICSIILLPADYSTWSPYKLQAALAHEAAHVRNADYYWHLAALVHRAVFWINPLAWWLPKRMAELAEARCDRDAVNAIGNPIDYAEVLLDFAAKPAPVSLTVQMAHSANLVKRVEHLLSAEVAASQVSSRARLFTGAGVLALTSLIAFTSCQQVATKNAAAMPSPESATRQAVIMKQPRIDPTNPLTMPEYVPSERIAEHEGTVFVAVLVDTDGRVAQSKILKSSGFEVLDQSAEAHARASWRFLPGTRNGEATAMWVTVPVVFKLTHKTPEPTA